MIPDQFITSAVIHSTPAHVWATLTTPALMAQWMGDPEMKTEVHTDWVINAPIIISGFHHEAFENKGAVLTFEKEKRLSYTHLSSVSRLADEEASYSVLDFIITPGDDDLLLTLTIKNFPTESIRRHLEFYWRATLPLIKEKAESTSVI